MVGFYPDYPDHRMAYERDGTEGYEIRSTNVITPLTPSQMQLLNAEHVNSQGSEVGFGGRWVLIFPELRDITGVWAFSTESSSLVGAVEVSDDTTNGLDGTWTQVVADLVESSGREAKPYYRTFITTFNALGKKAIRLHAISSIALDGLHVFGKPSSGQNPDRLELWHPSLDQRVGPEHFDFGDIPRGTQSDKTFRVKNLSASLTATTITVSLDAPTDANPSVPGWLSLSDDGSTFGSTVQIASLAPGAISGVLTLRRVVPLNAQLGLWTFRVKADAASMA